MVDFNLDELEEFSPKTAFRTTQPKITIQKGGTFSLNAAALEKLRKEGESEEDHIPVVFLYGAKNRMVVLRRDDKSPNAYKIRKQPGSVSYLVSGAAFTRHHGIAHEEAKRYDARVLGEHMVGFSLDDEHQVVGREVAKD